MLTDGQANRKLSHQAERMTQNDELPQMDGYIAVKQAADIIGISPTRVYELIEEGRLATTKISGVIVVSKKSAEAFIRKAPGRARTKGPNWHKYTSPAKLLTTTISIKIKEGQERRLFEKLDAIREGQLHTLKGSVARYISIDPDEPDYIVVWLAWKDTEMPDEIVQAEEMAAFRAELADVLDWDTAFYEERDGLLYT